MTRILFVLVIVWLAVHPSLAQSPTKKADQQFDQLSYARAIELYEQALANPGKLTDDERRNARAKLGYSYQQIRDTQNAERVYHDLISDGALAADYDKYYLFYAQALASNGKYREAQEAYDKYGRVQASDRRSSSFSKLYSDVSALTRNAGSYKVEFLTMNTRKAEFSPIFYKDGLVFVSAGTRDGIKRVFEWNNTPFLDLYYLPDLKTIRTSTTSSLGGSSPSARQERTNLLRPLGSDDFTAQTANDTRTVGFYGGNTINTGYEDQPISESDRFSRSLNTKYHEGPATFSKDGTRVIFTRNNFNGGKYRKSADGINKLKLYTATQTNGVWSKAEELPFNSDEYSTGHPALSKNRTGEPDQLLYFSSDRPGGLGGTDIYVSTWTNGKWGEPVNLGKEINTKGNELFPFADDKGNIYFSSDGRSGLGGLDIFYAQLPADGQQGPVVRNLGEPINSSQDDFGIVTDGERNAGYFSSNRKHGGADDDVYRFTREGSLYPCRELTVSVVDAVSKEPLVNTRIDMDNPDNDKQKNLKTDAEGLVRICLHVDSDFSFLTTREGYIDNKVGFSTKGLSDDQPSRLEILLDKSKASDRSTAITLRGRVTAQTDKSPIAGVKVVLVNGCDGKTQEAVTGPDGSYEFAIKPGCDYALEAMKNNMGTMGRRVAKDGTGTTDLTMFKKGDIIKIDNIHYDLNKSTIRPDAAVELDKVAALLAKYPRMTIEMRSHTDSRATTGYNKTLSSNRARAAVSYLKSKGISPKRLLAKGYGESELLNGCKDGVDCPEEEHQQNRRTEIKIVRL